MTIGTRKYYQKGRDKVKFDIIEKTITHYKEVVLVKSAGGTWGTFVRENNENNESEYWSLKRFFLKDENAARIDYTAQSQVITS